MSKLLICQVDRNLVKQYCKSPLFLSSYTNCFVAWLDTIFVVGGFWHLRCKSGTSSGWLCHWCHRLLHSPCLVVVGLQWGIRHGSQVNGITVGWLAGLYINWKKPRLQWYLDKLQFIAAHMTVENSRCLSNYTDSLLHSTNGRQFACR